MIRGKWAVAGLFGAMLAMGASQVMAQTDVIEKRQELMKRQSADVKAIKAAAESKDYATIETKAKDLMSTSSQIPELFPKGSTKGKTKATDAIWEKATAAGFRIDCFTSEYDSPQFEFTLTYDEALKAVDDIFLFRLISARQREAKSSVFRCYRVSTRTLNPP